MAFLSWASSLQYCKPVQEWSSKRRCLAQNLPLQWPQSPTILRATEVHELNEQRFFLDFFFVEVAGVLAGAGVASGASAAFIRMTVLWEFEGTKLNVSSGL